jgi:DNA modification methylase
MSHNGRRVQVTLEGKEVPEDWNFAKADTSYLTHGLHDYPARMIPQIAQRLLERYTPERGRILDPFCGSGTTLVEARLANRDAVGIDINPLAVLLSKVKSCAINFAESGFDVAKFLSTVEQKYTNAETHGKLPEPPKEILPNLLHWFKEPITRDLEFLYETITEVKGINIRDFFNIVLSDTVFRTSNIDLRSSRFIRILHEKELAAFSPNVLKHFRKKTLDSVARMTQYTRRLAEMPVDDDQAVTVRKADARILPFRKDEFDAAVTSPPYGEEKNTVGYARWSKLSVAWLRLNEDGLKESEKQSLGAASDKNTLLRLNEIHSPTVIGLLGPILKADPERVRDALPFFFDYLKTLEEVYRVLKPGAFYCIVIGDRSIRKKLLDMEKVTIELGAAVGFEHVESFFRTIPMKLIPWNTPTGKTISRESIIILQKK